MPRLFVAFRPPAAVRDALSATMDGIDGARWQDDEQLHLTLRFIGEVDGHQADDAAVALSSIDAAPVTAAIDGVGAFDHRGRIESLHARVSPRHALTLLHQKIDRALVLAGLDTERRRYLPHITVARGRADAADVARWTARHAALTSVPFTVDHIGLYESRIGRDGARYTELLRVPLNARRSSR